MYWRWQIVNILVSTFAGVQTPNCVRQTVFDAVALDYRSVTVLVDATAAATPEVHHGMMLKRKHFLLSILPLKE